MEKIHLQCELILLQFLCWQWLPFVHTHATLIRLFQVVNVADLATVDVVLDHTLFFTWCTETRRTL